MTAPSTYRLNSHLNPIPALAMQSLDHATLNWTLANSGDSGDVLTRNPQRPIAYRMANGPVQRHDLNSLQAHIQNVSRLLCGKAVCATPVFNRLCHLRANLHTSSLRDLQSICAANLRIGSQATTRLGRNVTSLFSDIQKLVATHLGKIPAVAFAAPHRLPPLIFPGIVTNDQTAKAATDQRLNPLWHRNDGGKFLPAGSHDSILGCKAYLFQWTKGTVLA